MCSWFTNHYAMRKSKRNRRWRSEYERKAEQVQQGINTESLLLTLLFWLILKDGFSPIQAPIFKADRTEKEDSRKTLDEFFKNWSRFYQEQKEKGNV